MTAREDLQNATSRLQELAARIGDASDRPVADIEDLARQASDLSAEVVEIIPRAIAEAEVDVRADADAEVGALSGPDDAGTAGDSRRA